MRLTRAAQRAQGNDETIDATSLEGRTPLNEISLNASPELGNHEEELPQKTPAKKSKGKGGAKKGAKGKKGKAVEEEVQAVLEDERAAAGSPASDAAVEELAKDPSTDALHTPLSNERPASPPSKAVRLTRRQLAMQEEELRQSRPATIEAQHGHVEDAQEEAMQLAATPASGSDSEDVFRALSQEPKAPQEETIATQEPEVVVQTERVQTGDTVPTAADLSPQIEAQEQKSIMPLVDITSDLEPKMLSSEKPCVSSTPTKSRTPSRRASRSPSKSPMPIEESIEALDALEEALENVEAVTSLHHSSDEKSPRKKAFPTDTPDVRSKTPMKAPLTALKISRTPSSAPKSIKPTKSSLARASSVRVAPSKDARKGSTDTVDYLASKRRPISMLSFPTPPPPPKGRAPTRATFQLSSTAVAEKLKAEKEERLKRQAEGIVPKQRPISLTLPLKSTKPPTKASFSLPGEKIAAELKAKKEERLKREAEGPPRSGAPRPISMPPPAPKSTKALTKATFELPGAAVAKKLKAQREERLKRQEEAEAAKKVAALKARPAPVRKPGVLPSRSQTGVTIAPPSQSQTQGSSSIVSKRSSIQLSRSTSTSSASHNSGLPTAKSTVTPVDAAAQRSKGREVFNRDKMEKEAKERERKEKEEAAKQARAQAAERGRIASREWAEKQKRKIMGV